VYCEERLPEMEVTRDASFFKKYRSEPNFDLEAKKK
jgi:hypothetical protein